MPWQESEKRGHPKIRKNPLCMIRITEKKKREPGRESSHASAAGFFSDSFCNEDQSSSVFVVPPRNTGRDFPVFRHWAYSAEAANRTSPEEFNAVSTES